jgi:hypothetical protein
MGILFRALFPVGAYAEVFHRNESLVYSYHEFVLKPHPSSSFFFWPIPKGIPMSMVYCLLGSLKL